MKNGGKCGEVFARKIKKKDNSPNINLKPQTSSSKMYSFLLLRSQHNVTYSYMFVLFYRTLACL